MKILLIGAEGRMGKAVRSLSEYPLLRVGSPKSSLPHDITPLLPTCDVVLDFSTASAVESNLPKIVAAKKPVVIGVTAITNQAFIDEASHHIPLFISSNFSYGISLLKKLLKHLPEGSYELTDLHHIHKKDAPSGTALDLAKHLPTPPKISSRREGSVIGEHTITLHLPFETLQFSHEVLDRNVFAKGALLACSFLVDKPPGLYTSIYD